MRWIWPPMRLQLCRAVLLSAGTALAAGDLLLISSNAVADEAPQSAAPSDGDATVLVGVGLVIGLPGTGDTDIDQAFVETSIVGVLRRAGLDVWRGQIEPGRVAKVLVSAEVPAGPFDGKRVDVSVTAVGDALSLAGGTLLVTPLRDADGKTYAVGQGQVEVGNHLASAELSEQPTTEARVGTLAEGAALDSDHRYGIAFD